ncbi:MAG TPA: DNA polymerase domain-containing protein [Vicinamibacterales bacterium]|nr:DNA polymerase domain-containing protein [Vicinamibacterales bacterium]
MYDAGWDPTPGIVSVWAEWDGRAIVWRRIPESGALVREDARFRPWALLDSLEPLGPPSGHFRYRELEGPGALRFLVHAEDGRRLQPLKELGKDRILILPPEEQYLVSTGRTYFRDLPFDALHRLQFDLETTGLDAAADRIFMIAIRTPDGATRVLEAAGEDAASEAELIRNLVLTIAAADPDVIENHNLHGFDLPFLARRARMLRVALPLGRVGRGLRQRPARRGIADEQDEARRIRYVAQGRELIDTMDAVVRYGFSTGDLPWRGLKAVARHFGVAAGNRVYIPGDRIYEEYRRDPAPVRRYAAQDVEEVAALARILGGAAFALAQMAPRRYERVADAGAATGIIDPLLVRAYIRAGHALPAYGGGDREPHTGAALHLFATGVARRVVKADVASLYPSLMRSYRIGPARDTLGAMLALVDRLVERRLEAKARARGAPAESSERFTHEAMSAALKLVVNSAYGYLAAGSGLTRFADVQAANEVTRRGRDVLALMCRGLEARGVTLLEADTDGVYFSVPDAWTDADERRVVSEVAALLPPLVQLEFDGRYRAMLSHEPKNYALLTYGGALILKGVAFRSSRAAPFGEAFLRRALERLLLRDIPGVRAAFVETVEALRRREIPTGDVSSRVRLTKTAARYLASRDRRRELTYEALLEAGRTSWTIGERVRVYRTATGGAGLVSEQEDGTRADAALDAHDYDVEHYVRVLRDIFSERLARALRPEHLLAIVADPMQPSLFDDELAGASTVLTPLPRAGTAHAAPQPQPVTRRRAGAGVSESAP